MTSDSSWRLANRRLAADTAAQRGKWGVYPYPEVGGGESWIVFARQGNVESVIASGPTWLDAIEAAMFKREGVKFTWDESDLQGP